MPEAFPSEHFGYVGDRRRTEQFRAALKLAVQPGSSVLDLGCGVGILGLLAIERGAGTVTGLDRSAAAELARDALRSQSGAAAVDVIRNDSFRADLTRSYDVVICDHVGYFGFDYGIIALLQDARTRFLKPGGRLVPAALDLYLAPVHAPVERALIDAATSPHVPPALSKLHDYAVNTKRSARIGRDGGVLSDPAHLCRIDLLVDQPHAFAWKAAFTVSKAGDFDGLAGWFDCTLCDSVRMTNSPLDPEPIDRPQAFLPIAERLSVEPGDRIECEVWARHEEELISWSVTHHPSGRRFRHSTFDGMVVTRADLARQRPAHRPRPTQKARARALVLEYCDGTRNRAEIEAAVMERHPDLFPTRRAIAHFLMDVLDRDTE